MLKLAFHRYDIYEGFPDGPVFDEIQRVLEFLEKRVESGSGPNYPIRSAVALLILAVIGASLPEQWIYGN